MEEHLHPVVDSDAYFTIDPITKNIKSASGKTALTQGDHNSERYTFKIPRIEGHDMSVCNKVRVHFTNTESTKDVKSGRVSKGTYRVTDLRVDPDDPNNVILSWLIDGAATMYPGKLDFLIKFRCVSDDVAADEDSAKVLYEWNTNIYSGVSVSPGMDNLENFATDRRDELAALESRMDEIEKNGVGGGQPKGIKELDLLAENWQRKMDGEWFQTFEFDFVTPDTDVEIRIDENAVKILENKTLTFDIANENGVVVIRAIGENVPTHDYTVQIVCEEVVWL